MFTFTFTHFQNYFSKTFRPQVEKRLSIFNRIKLVFKNDLNVVNVVGEVETDYDSMNNIILGFNVGKKSTVPETLKALNNLIDETISYIVYLNANYYEYIGVTIGASLKNDIINIYVIINVEGETNYES